MRLRRWIPTIATAVACAACLFVLSQGLSSTSNRLERRTGSDRHLSQVGAPGDESAEAYAAIEEWTQARLAPGLVLPGAYLAAYNSLTGLPTSGGAWTEVTNRPYDSDDPRYRDPAASNSGGGAGFVTGRIVGIAVSGNTLYVGGANGGVFRSANGGTSWTPIADGLPSLSVGDLRLAPDGALWLATGEANTGATAFVGSGVYRLASPATGQFFVSNRVGGSELESTFIGKLRFDGNGSVYAATSRGVWKHSATTSNGAWTRVLYPVPDPADPSQQSPYNNICNDVAIDPSSGGSKVLANCAWRSGASYNGFYLSTDAGAKWTRINPIGAINAQDVGRATLAYSADGSRLYTVMESMVRFEHTQNTVLSGVFASMTGDPSGPWVKIADSQKLASSGSALKLYIGYRPGVQAWYNQFAAVDPGNPDHLFLGLEEVFETTDAGVHWRAIGPYWNFGFPCWSSDPTKNTCPATTHADQHSVAFDSGTPRMLYVGDDGGLYRRPVNGTVNADGHATDWQNLNANIRTLQYYSVGVGAVSGGVAVWGGLQDNGVSLLLPEDASGHMGSPFGGDGGDVLVDPNNGCRVLAEYVYLDLEITTNCGVSDGTFAAIRDVAPSDPNPRFIAPFRADTVQPDHWVAGGQYIWTSSKGFGMTSSSDWAKSFDNGSGHSTTALASQNDVVWSAWCGPCNVDGFARGISTNVNGTWSQLTLPSNVPKRFISSIAIDPSDASGHTAYVAFSGFSRVWSEGPGAGIGHLWKTTDGGATWTNVSGNLPDIPANSVVIRAGKLIVGTDLAVLVSTNGGSTWSRLGSQLPLTAVMYLHVGPDSRLYAATHGRGIWSIVAP